MKRKPKLLIGIHDSLSALLAEKAGFKMLWASGFGFATVHGIPDVNLLTLSENVDILRKILNVTSLPIIADCDSGYGDIVIVQRLVKEYERIGVKGICIEDNIFPKRCSFIEGIKRKLVAVLEHISSPSIPDVLQETRRVIRKGGRLVVRVPSTNQPLEPKHYQHFTESSLRQVLSANGLTVEQIIGNHNTALDWNDYYSRMDQASDQMRYRAYQEIFAICDPAKAKRLLAVSINI